MKAFVLFSALKTNVRILFLGLFLVFFNFTLYSSTFNKNNVIAANYYEAGENIVYNGNMETHKDSLNTIREKNIPPLDPYRIAGEAVSGAFVGAIGGFGTMYLFQLPLFGSVADVYGDDLGWSMISTDIGWILGNQFGAYIVGNLGNETGSLPKTLIYGTAISLGIQVLAFGAEYYYTSHVTDGPSNTPIFGIIEVTAPIIGSVIGFNLTRRYKTACRRGKGLISINNKKLRVNVPGMFLHLLYGDEVVGIRLFNMNF